MDAVCRRIVSAVPGVLLLVVLPVFAEGPVASEAIRFRPRNPAGVDLSPGVVRHRVDLPDGAFVLRGPDGNEIPSWYDRAAGEVEFVDALTARSRGWYTVEPGAEPRTAPPAWQGNAEGLFADLNNGRLALSVSLSREGNALMVEIRGEGGYRFLLHAGGYAVGCVGDVRDAQPLDESRIFGVEFGTPTRMEILAPSPFRREVLVHCTPTHRRADGEDPGCTGGGTVRIGMEWGSPIVRLHTVRNVTRRFYNHNGVSLFQVQNVESAIDVELEGGRRIRSVAAVPDPNPPDTGFRKALLVVDGGSRTVLHCPEFRALDIDGGRLTASGGSIEAFIAQSWGQGWRPIEIPAGVIEDHLTLVCDVPEGRGPEGRGAKSLDQWISEIESR